MPGTHVNYQKLLQAMVPAVRGVARLPKTSLLVIVAGS